MDAGGPQPRDEPGGQAGEQHGDAAGLEGADGVREHGRARGVEGRDVGHPQDDDAHVADLGQLEQRGVGPTEEQRPFEPEGDDVLLEQRGLLGPVVRVVLRVGHPLGVQGRGAGELAQGEAPGGDDAEDDRRREVEHHGGDEGQHQDEGVAARGPGQCP